MAGRRRRFARAAYLTLVLALASTPRDAAAGQAPRPAAPAIAVTPAGVTEELSLRDGTRAYGRVEKVDGGLVTFRTTAGATLEVQAAEIVSVHLSAGRCRAENFGGPIRIRRACSSVRPRAH